MLPDDRFRFGTFFVYVGQKQKTGHAAARAGLVGGDLYALHIENGADEGVYESLKQPFSGRFELRKLNAKSEIDAMQEEALHERFRSVNGSWFRRPEDVAWHPAAPHRFVLVTTDANRPRIYRFEFDDINNVVAGGTIRSLLQDVPDDHVTRQATSIEQLGDQLVIGLDNLVLDAQGNAIVCEDGGQGKFVCFRVCFRAKYKLIFAFVDAPNRMFLLRQAGGPPGNDLINQNTDKYNVETIVIHNPQLFGTFRNKPATAPFTKKTKFAATIDMGNILGPGWFLASNQAHEATTGDDEELLEKGQIMAFFVPSLSDVEPIKDIDFPQIQPSMNNNVDANSTNNAVPWWPFLVGVLILAVIVSLAGYFSWRHGNRFTQH